jgi:hypothetical protein
MNLNVAEDTHILGCFASLEDAFQASLADVVAKDGKNILVHGHQVEGYESSDKRITNGCSLGSQYGVTYNSYYSNYPCCRMIVPQNVL